MTLPTLSHLLSSQEARDAAPCVAVTGEWVLNRAGVLYNTADMDPGLDCNRNEDGSHKWEACFDIIWSGDLPALLAAMVAENEGLKRQTMGSD